MTHTHTSALRARLDTHTSALRARSPFTRARCERAWTLTRARCERALHPHARAASALSTETVEEQVQHLDASVETRLETTRFLLRRITEDMLAPRIRQPDAMELEQSQAGYKETGPDPGLSTRLMQFHTSVFFLQVSDSLEQSLVKQLCSLTTSLTQAVFLLTAARFKKKRNLSPCF